MATIRKSGLKAGQKTPPIESEPQPRIKRSHKRPGIGAEPTLRDGIPYAPPDDDNEEDEAGPETPFDDERTEGEALAQRLDGYDLIEGEGAYGRVDCECNVWPCRHNNPR